MSRFLNVLPQRWPLLFLAFTAVACFPASTYERDELSKIKRIALVSVAGELRDYEKPIGCLAPVTAYAKALDNIFKGAGDFHYVPMASVERSPTYRLAPDLKTESSLVTGPSGTKYIRLNQATTGSLCRDLNVDALLVATIEYYLRNDQGKIQFWAYPGAKLYTPKSEKPVWDFTGSGNSKELAIPVSMSSKLGLKWVVFAKASEEEVGELMKLGNSGDGGLALPAAGQVKAELQRVLRVARGEESLSFIEVASSGDFGKSLEGRAMGAAFVLAVGFFILSGLLSWYASKNEEGAGGCFAFLSISAALFYFYQFIKAAF
jgi:hypothetical protein